MGTYQLKVSESVLALPGPPPAAGQLGILGCPRILSSLAASSLKTQFNLIRACVQVYPFKQQRGLDRDVCCSWEDP